MKGILLTSLTRDTRKEATSVEKKLAETCQAGKGFPSFKVVRENNLQAGLACLERKEIDAVIITHDVPEKQAEEALKDIQARYPHTPILILYKEHGPEHTRLMSFTEGMDVLFQKELSAPLLAQTLANAIRLAETKKELIQARHNAQKHRATFQAVRQASLQLTSTLALQPVLEAVLENALAFISADDAHIFLYDGKNLEFRAALFDGKTQKKPYAAIRKNDLTYTVAESGRRIVVSDAKTHPLFKNQDWNGAIMGLPLKIGNKVQGVMNIAFERQYKFSEDEIHTLQLLGDQAAIAIHNAQLYEKAQQEIAERKQVEKALKETRNRYRKLFQSMTSAFAVHKVVLDENNKPCDYRFLEVNEAFENLTNLKAKDLVGKTVLEVLPEIGEYWINRFGWVAITGKPIYFEDYSPELDKHYAVTAYRPQKGKFATLFTDITARKVAGKALKESEERYRKLFNSSTDAIMTLDPPDWKFSSGNSAILEMFKIENEKEFTSLTPWDISPKKQPDGCLSSEKAKEMISLALKKGSFFLEWTHQRQNGEEFPATVLLTRIDIHEKVFLQATVRDITDRKRIENVLKESEEKYRILFERIPIGLYRTTPSGEILDANPAMVKMLKYPDRKTLLQTKTPALFAHPEDFKKQRTLLKEHGMLQGFRMQVRCYDKTLIWVQDTTQVIRNNKGEVYYQGSFEDITKRKHMEEEIKHMANHDALTNLPNRRLFNERIQLEMAHARRNQQKLGVLLFDLDGFKDVNDTLGHTTGDQLLKILSKRLIKIMRESDTIARMGGDEFLVLLPGIDNSKDAAKTAQRIIKVVREPFSFNGYKIHLTTSIGIAFYPENGKDVDTLVKNADIAMYRAKRQGGDRYHYYQDKESIAHHA